MRIPFFGTFTRSASTSAPSIEDITSTMRSELGLSLRADSFNEATRSVTATASTDNPVQMFDIEYWEIVDEILVGDAGEFPAEIPMLDSHDRSSVFSVLGNGTKATMSNGSWNILLTFDDDDDSSRAMRKVQKRYIRDVSVGYTVDSCFYISPGQTETINGRSYTAGVRRLKVCTKWRANEISLTPIGADKDAKIRAAVAINGKPKPKPAVRCDELAADLHDLIQDTGLPRDEVVSDMASAAGMSVSEVDEILAGDVAPDTEQLDGFAAALETDTQLLQLV